MKAEDKKLLKQRIAVVIGTLFATAFLVATINVVSSNMAYDIGVAMEQANK